MTADACVGGCGRSLTQRPSARARVLAAAFASARPAAMTAMERSFSRLTLTGKNLFTVVQILLVLTGLAFAPTSCLA